MKKLRLLLTPDCNRNCEKCCNKQIDLRAVPYLSRIDYDEVMITGGEPMLYPQKVKDILRCFRVLAPNAKLIVYTAKPSIELAILLEAGLADSITLTLHNSGDVTMLNSFDNILSEHNVAIGKKLRLNIFKEVDAGRMMINKDRWIIKDNIEWLDECPVPEDEEFRRLVQ